MRGSDACSALIALSRWRKFGAPEGAADMGVDIHERRRDAGCLRHLCAVLLAICSAFLCFALATDAGANVCKPALGDCRNRNNLFPGSDTEYLGHDPLLGKLFFPYTAKWARPQRYFFFSGMSRIMSSGSFEGQRYTRSGIITSVRIIANDRPKRIE